ncbi:LysR family transcriptional regulator [Pseudonocardia alni]|uniref:LysR family transcriptional regulator n=1 Tax=Pseudonocardia alni TaxID=33907 RepID=UPI00280B8EDF|nr:LysR family transcriptional regulator [Pseudonocardia alni]
MNVEWSRLRVLHAVARAGTVKRAAELLHMTGPAVSQQLRRIEAEAGIRVVIPDGRGVRLTSEGRVLADYAAQVAELMARAENDLHNDNELAGRICIGALASIIRTTLADLLPAFQRGHRRVELRVEDGETTWHLERLLDGHLDLVLAESWSPAPLLLPAGITARRVGRDPLWIALPGDHPLHGRPVLDLADLASEVWATCARDSDGHRAMTQLARASGVELDVRHHVADHATQLALVRAGLAVACVPVPTQHPHNTGVTYRRLSTEVHRDILLLTSNAHQPRTVDSLVAHLTATPQRLGVS